jgi:hypothetical protein
MRAKMLDNALTAKCFIYDVTCWALFIFYLSMFANLSVSVGLYALLQFLMERGSWELQMCLQ